MTPTATYPKPSTVKARGGFSLVEMMTVVAILLMAFGLMVPSLADFFRNRVLDVVSGEFGSAFNTARMQAVMNGRPFAVVFFQEGIRVYDVKRKTWAAGDEFDPARGQTAHSAIRWSS